MCVQQFNIDGRQSRKEPWNERRKDRCILLQLREIMGKKIVKRKDAGSNCGRIGGRDDIMLDQDLLNSVISIPIFCKMALDSVEKNGCRSMVLGAI